MQLMTTGTNQSTAEGANRRDLSPQPGVALPNNSRPLSNTAFAMLMSPANQNQNNENLSPPRINRFTSNTNTATQAFGQ